MAKHKKRYTPQGVYRFEFAEKENYTSSSSPRETLLYRVTDAGYAPVEMQGGAA